jgi:hypothetical protein
LQKHSTIPTSKKEGAVANISHATNLLLERQKMSSNKVLLLLPLSGPHREIGNNILKACLLSANEFHNSKISFYVIDTANSSLDKYALYEKFNGENLKAILGPIFFYEAKQFGALFPNTPIFTFSNNLDVNNAHVFSCGISPLDEIRTIFAYVKKHKLYDFLFLLPENELGDQLQQYINQEASKSHFNDLGEIEIVRYRSISSQNVRKFIKNSKKKAVFLIDPVVNPRDFTNIHVFTLSSSVFANQELWHGAYFAFSNEHHLQKFKDKYQRIYGNTPGILEAIGYDICNFLYDIILCEIPEDFFCSKHEGCLGAFFIKKNSGLKRKLFVRQLNNATDSDDDNQENDVNDDDGDIE